MSDTSTKYISLLVVIFFAGNCTNIDTQKRIRRPSIDSAGITLKSKVSSSITYDSTKKYVYLTFDDGPQNGTMNCFRIMRELDVKGTFFMIGTQVYDKKLLKKVDSVRNGYPQFLLANHSYTHANYNHYKTYYHAPDSALKDILKVQATLNVPLKIFRTPGNNSWNIKGRLKSPQLTKDLCVKLDSMGYISAGWDIEWHFKIKSGMIPVESADSIINEIEHAMNGNENFVKNHVVLLTHDRMFEKSRYADSLHKVIISLKQNPQIVFETIDHYPGIARNN